MHFWRWLWTGLFCLLVVSVLGLVKFNQIKAAIAFGESFPEPSETVRIQVTQKSEWQPTLSVMGEVLATRSIGIRNELGGIITKVGFGSGASVTKGQLLLQLDIDNELAQLEALKAQTQINQLDVNRFAELVKSNASSREQFDRATAQLAVAKANMRALQSIIAKKTLTAPFDGVVGLHQIEVGAYLSANTLITRLVDHSDGVWVDFLVPQEHANLAVGDEVDISSTSLLYQNYTAKIIALSQEIDPDSRHFKVRALWSQVPSNIKPGGLIEVRLSTADSISVFRLPNVAIRYDAFGAYVFSLTKDDKGDWRAARKVITVTANQDKTAIITSGLNENDTIATIGSSKLKQGMLVNVAASTGNVSNE